MQPIFTNRVSQVTMVYRDQQFRMHFENKRILEELSKEGVCGMLRASKPLKTIAIGEILRFISKIP